jgi:hypothetical protein
VLPHRTIFVSAVSDLTPVLWLCVLIGGVTFTQPGSQIRRRQLTRLSLTAWNGEEKGYRLVFVWFNLIIFSAPICFLFMFEWPVYFHFATGMRTKFLPRVDIHMRRNPGAVEIWDTIQAAVPPRTGSDQT